MFDGKMVIDILNAETCEITRAAKSFSLSFQPYEGMNIDTGLSSYTIDAIEWSLEHMTFFAQIYLVMSEHSLDYVNEFEINRWEISKFEPTEKYYNNFVKEHRSPVIETIACDFCNGAGKGEDKTSTLGPAQSTCNRCSGLGKIKRPGNAMTNQLKPAFGWMRQYTLFIAALAKKGNDE